ncbi:MAG: hypothetical protein JRN42_04505 [Nitrososphaerota archaeon]|nr:hypothetical protein [Nitrososphaerota archaeon]
MKKMCGDFGNGRPCGSWTTYCPSGRCEQPDFAVCRRSGTQRDADHVCEYCAESGSICRPATADDMAAVGL